MLTAAENNKGQRISFELKGPGWPQRPELLKRVGQMITRHELTNRVYLSPDTNDELLLSMAEHIPDIKTAWKPDASANVTPRTARDYSVDVVWLLPTEINKELVDRLHAKGFQVWVRLNDNREVWKSLKSMNVDAILTDKPEARFFK